ncbi:hypothetical protein CC78DRAFT_76472 [Lojkania enalia]|uniref:Copper homeostasis protein cutC homolog n=1 Tax=Lojkania enalia TaxID=147567 RepID=A0A9P4KDV2_9PLEO|nr:hypothetical protein CC78DRAFT_76472 [Didymosphaeria enalia]
MMLEIACFNTSSSLTAARAGADRIELCSDYAAGGVTPSQTSLQDVRRQTEKPVNVMIRPRPGNFLYSTAEFEQMKSEIKQSKPHASGFVFGILDANNYVDMERNRLLVRLAAPLPCTFHRAFDQISNLEKATEQVIECGFTSILTSGGKVDAWSGAQTVTKLQKQFGSRILFILGGGVRSTNIETLKQQTNVLWYHSAAITQPGESADEGEVVRLHELLIDS